MMRRYKSGTVGPDRDSEVQVLTHLARHDTATLRRASKAKRKGLCIKHAVFCEDGDVAASLLDIDIAKSFPEVCMIVSRRSVSGQRAA